jgi:hypothetical protein
LRIQPDVIGHLTSHAPSRKAVPAARRFGCAAHEGQAPTHVIADVAELPVLVAELA